MASTLLQEEYLSSVSNFVYYLLILRGEGYMGEVNLSVLGRLLVELSWEGPKIKKYRNGGSGYENVLTTEVFQSLDFLPREMFLGEIIKNLEGSISNELKTMILKDIEIINFTLLPGDIFLSPNGINVQPDGIIESDHVYCLLEAKRIKNGQFSPQQLAREYTLVTKEARGRQPLLMLVLGENPPVKVRDHGRISVKDSILIHLESVLGKTKDHPYNFEQLAKMIDSSVAWITWDQINEIVTRKLENFEFNSESPNTYNCISRLVTSITDSIKRHKI